MCTCVCNDKSWVSYCHANLIENSRGIVEPTIFELQKHTSTNLNYLKYQTDYFIIETFRVAIHARVRAGTFL